MSLILDDTLILIIIKAKIFLTIKHFLFEVNIKYRVYINKICLINYGR